MILHCAGPRNVPCYQFHVVFPNLVAFIGPIDANPRDDLFLAVHFFCLFSPTSPEKLAFLIAESSKDNI
jgi:hypothetical protein